MPECDFSSVDDAQDFSPLPPGDYPCRLAAIDPNERTKAGDEMWKLRFVVKEGDYRGRLIFDRISFGEAALPRVKLLCSALGLDVAGKVNLSSPSKINLISTGGKGRRKSPTRLFLRAIAASRTVPQATLRYRRTRTMLPSDGSIPSWLAVAAFVFGYIWAANARMDVVWDQGYEAGIRQLSEACEEE